MKWTFYFGGPGTLHLAHPAMGGDVNLAPHTYFTVELSGSPHERAEVLDYLMDIVMDGGLDVFERTG